MRRSEYINLVERLLAHVENGTTDCADSVKYVPVRNYLDPDRWHREMDHIFKRLPLLLALTCEMPEAGDYRAIELLSVPVLIVRGDDSVARAFIGVCSHRGTTIADEGRARCEHFTCPYHGWTYNFRGELIGVAGRKKFGDIEVGSRGLTALPCAERAGMIFVCLTPQTIIDIETYLGGMLPELESFGLERWHLFSRNELPTSNWKVAHDGYLEGYHFSTLHPDTIARQVMTNIMTYDAYGAHQRVAFPTHGIRELRSRPKDEWVTDDGVAVVRTVFPNVSFAISARNGGLLSQLIPGPTSEKSRTIQSHIFPHPPATDQERATMEASVKLFIGAVEKEDNWVCARIQRGLDSGANRDFVFGRNELGLHRLHDCIDHYLRIPIGAPVTGVRLTETSHEAKNGGAQQDQAHPATAED